MSEAFLGEIRLFGFNFAPLNWMLCQGQLLPISQNTALFSLLGTNFGGNGINIFGIPNLANTVAVGAGTGPGLSTYAPGETGGDQTVNLTVVEMPPHSHTVQTGSARLVSDKGTPGPTVVFAKGVQCKPYTPAAQGGTPVQMAPLAVSPYVGGNAPHENMMPYLAVNFSICINGIFPPRP